MNRRFKLLASTFESFRSIQDDPIVFLAPAVTWAFISTALVVLYCVAVIPANVGLSLGTMLDTADSVAPLSALVRLVSTFVGGTVLSFCVIQWKLLGRDGNNPFFGAAEWPRYFFYSAGISAIAATGIIPALFMGVLLYAFLPHTQEYRAVAGAAALLSGCAIFFLIYARICLALPAAANGERLSLMQSFRMTKGNSLRLAGGLLLTFAIPFLVFALLRYFAYLSRLGSDQTPGMIVWEVLRDIETIAIYGFMAFFTAIAYDTLRSPAAEELAKQFE